MVQLGNHDGPEIGATGARFGGGSRKRRKARPAPPESSTPTEAPSEAPTETPPVTPSAETPPATPSGAADRVGHDDTGPAGETAGEAMIQIVKWPLPDLATSEPADLETASPVSVRVRPYVLTGGRTRTDVELTLETLVSAGSHPALEHHSVVELCRWPISVAEVAALLGVPIGVARVVIGDLVIAGSLIVHAHNVQDVSDLKFLERVLTGLRAL